MNQSNAPKFAIAFAGLFVLLVVVIVSCVTIVEPGHRGVKVTLGKVSGTPLAEGIVFKLPLGITKVHEINVQQQKEEGDAACFSRDLQTVTVKYAIMFRANSGKVVELFRDYRGDPFESLVRPRLEETIKEVVASYEAEELVANREKARQSMRDRVTASVGNVIEIVDVNIVNIDLTDDLEKKIEEKMVAQQEALKMTYVAQKEKTQAEITLIQARAEAEAAQIRGAAITANPLVLQMEILKKWNGVSPTVVMLGNNQGEGGPSVILPLIPSGK